MMKRTLSRPDRTESVAFDPVYESLGEGVRAPRSFTWSRHRPGDVVVEIDVEVTAGRAMFKEVRILATDDRPTISARDLSRLPLATMLEQAVMAAASHDHGSRSMPYLLATDDDNARRDIAVRKVAARSGAAVRRPIDEDRLRAAVEVYKRVTGTGGTIRKAADAFDVGEAQMYRYLKAAREQGLLPESTRGAK